MRQLAWCLLLAAFGFCARPASAADLTRIERTIAKEPAYKGQPKYFLLVFGPEARTRVWLVLDGDVLYVDRNGNGDLTEPDEQLGRPAPLRSGAKWFVIGKILERDSQTMHTDLRVLQNKDRFQIHIHLRNSQLQVAGKYDEVQELGPNLEWLRFGDRPSTAPIVHFNGPLTFKLARDGPLTPGQAAKVCVAVGTPGLGDGTFAYVRDVPAKVRPTAEFDFPTAQGRKSANLTLVPDD